MRISRRFRPRILQVVVCLSCFVVVSGCGKDLAVEDFGKIDKGMTQQQVESILAGKEITWAEVAPRVAKIGTSELSETSCDTWLQWGNRKGLGVIGLKDGKVTELFFD